MEDTFELIKIDSAETLEELYEKEIYYINQYDSNYFVNKNGYNMSFGGEGNHGYNFTEEDKQKMSESRKKYFKDNPEGRKKGSEAQKKDLKILKKEEKIVKEQKIIIKIILKQVKSIVKE